MNQKLTTPTKEKIVELTLYHFKLWSKTGDSFLTLMDIFSEKEPTILKPNQIGFKNYSKAKCLEFLAKKNLITNSHMITVLGMAVILSHKLNISIFSVFILSKLHHWQTTINKDMAFPLLTLERTFELFPSVSILCRNIYDMKQKQVLDNNLRYRLARINIHTLNDLKKYDNYLKAISQYVDDTSEKIDALISADSLVIKQRTQNLKLLAGMNFA